MPQSKIRFYLCLNIGLSFSGCCVMPKSTKQDSFLSLLEYWVVFLGCCVMSAAYNNVTGVFFFGCVM
jgi:hypothetical protein